MATLRAYWQHAGKTLGPFATLSTSEVAVGPRRQRTLVARTTSTAISLGSDRARSDRWRLAWVYIVSGDLAGNNRGILQYVPRYGGLLLDRGFGTTVASGVEFDISGILPLFETNGIPGLATWVNRAHDDLVIDGRLSLSATANAQELSASIATYPWLTSTDRVVYGEDGQPIVYERRQSGFARVASWRRRVFEMVGPTPTLRFLDRGYPIATTIQLAVRRPSSSLVSDADSTTGLVNVAHTAMLRETDVTPVALWYACRWLAGWPELTPEEREVYAARAERYEADARRLPNYWPEIAARRSEAA